MKTYNFAVIRELIDAACDDEDLRILCHDHFPKVYHQFTSGQTKGSRTLLLVEYAQRHGQIEKLLNVVKRNSRYQYERFEPDLWIQADEDAPSDSDGAQPAASTNLIQGEIIQGPIIAGQINNFKQVFHNGSSCRPERPSQETLKNRDLPTPSIGIITALEKEHAAVEVLMENGTDYTVPGKGAGRRYWVGDFASSTGGKQHCVLTMAAMGNNIAATRATLMLQHFPSITSIIMVGIAGAAPHPEKPDDHVRLGDIVVSNEGSVIQYDMDKEEIDRTIHRHPPRPPSSELLEAVRYLKSRQLLGRRPWEPLIDLGLAQMNQTRPLENDDELVDTRDPKKKIAHPSDPNRIPGKPRIFSGPIASANKLLKNPKKRDALRDKFGVKAVEMEGSGIADATWHHDVGYLVVRGTCDYCDGNKNDVWQEYAAMVAAAYTRALIESMA